MGRTSKSECHCGTLVGVYVCVAPSCVLSCRVAFSAPGNQQVPGPHLLHSQEDYQSQGSRKDQVRAVQCVVGRGLARSVVLLHSHACMQRCICDDVEEAGVLSPHGNDMVPIAE